MKKYQINKVKTGDNIRLLIQKSEYTIEQIADKLEFNSSRVIYEWMNGNKLPTLENMINLARLVNKKVEQIVVIELMVHCN